MDIKNWVIAIVSVIIEGLLIWKGMSNLAPDIIASVTAIINAIFTILGLLFIPAVDAVYFTTDYKIRKLRSGKK
ncbi:MAG: hypothetical protein MUP81_00140 [Dehalococcoidia bacterium]|nr:hypothetical protein [Dehalococcoidia bacterium]